MEVTVAFIDDHRNAYGVEPICGVLPIAPSTYFRHKAHQSDPTRRSARAQRDDELCAIIRRIWTEHHQVCGPRKVWRQMGREKLRAARCRVRRLMRKMGLTGATRGPALGDDHAGRTGRERQADLSSVGSPPRGQISSGSRISPTWRRGVASCKSRLSLISMRVASSDGGSPRPLRFDGVTRPSG
jgi:transposase InsO family protein